MIFALIKETQFEMHKLSEGIEQGNKQWDALLDGSENAPLWAN